MNPLKNPFSPGAGTPPPELAGRTEILNQAQLLLQRVAQRRPEKSILLTGLRGVGKTVLLNEMERMAQKEGYLTIMIEATEGCGLGELLAHPLRKLFFDLSRMDGLGDRVKKGLIALRNFAGTIKFKYGEFGLDLEPYPGLADSGSLEEDLPELFQAVGEAALERNAKVALLIDEVQYFSEKELSALIMAMHKIQQKQQPVILIGAGLPILPQLAGESKSYAERLFHFPSVGALAFPDVLEALQGPVQREKVQFSERAIRAIFSLTHGYPYFIQEWGYQAWNQAKFSPISQNVIEEATPHVMKRLDDNFFKVRFDRLTPSEKRFLRGMAELKKEAPKAKEIAEILGTTVTSISPVRSKLLKKGMIYSPSHGLLSYSVPLFGEFIIRSIPLQE